MLAVPAAAQEPAPPEDAAVPGDRVERWQPLGQLPVDQAGAGLRGYVLAAEGAEVAAPGSGRVSVQAVAANNFYREQSGDLLITERFETHTLAVGYRRGFKVGSFPRFELGGQIQLNERDTGFLNGFI